jgi:tetratricopeptide (TPR) repeat protein
MGTGDFTLDRLWALLSRYCTDSIVGEFQQHITKMRQTESELLESASKRGAEKEEEQNVLDRIQLEIILERCEQHLPTREYLELLLEVGNLCADYDDHQRAEELYTTVRKAAAGKLSFANQAGFACLHKAELSVRHARWDEALDRLKESRKHFARTRYQRGLALVENHLGVYYAQQGDIRQARQHFKRALAVFEKTNDVERLSTILMDLGILSNIAGDWEEAVSNYQRALPEFEKAGSIQHLAELHHNMAMTLLAKRDYRSAVSQFDESLTYANQLDYQHLKGLALLGKATAYARMGDHPLAMAFSNRALNIFRQVRDQLSVADSYKVKAIVQRELNNLDVAELYLQTSIRLNQQFKNALNLGESYFELGVLHSKRNQPQKALQALRRSALLFKRVGARQELTAAQQLMMQLKK